MLPIPEFTMVHTTRSLECDGRLVPDGSKGAVVATHDNGLAYEVEFVDPFPCVVTVERGDIRPL